MKKLILTLFGLILSTMSVYAQVAPLAGLTVAPNSAANPTIITLTWDVYVQGTTPATGFVIERSPNNAPANFVVLTTVTNLTSITYTDAVIPDSYCYRMRAINGFGLPIPVPAPPISPYSPYFPLTGGICANLPIPAAPVVTATPDVPTAPTSITLSWTHAGTDATTTRFLIERSSINATTGFAFLATVTVAVPSIPANFTYTNTGLTPSNYYYRVRAANIFLFSPYSPVASVIIPALAIPGALTATPNATISTSNVLSWGATPNALAYDVEVSSTLTGAYVLLASVPAPAVTYAHNMTGGNYCYRIRATVGSAVSSYNTAVCTTPIPCASAILDRPTNVTATVNIQVNTISLSWDDNASGETGYKVWRSVTPNFTPGPTSTYTSAIQNATGYANANNPPTVIVSINTTYYYIVAAYCGSSLGDFSDEIAVSTTIAAASEFTANIRPNELIIDLEWLANIPVTTVLEDSTQIERTIDGPVLDWKFLKSVKNPGEVLVIPPGGGPSGPPRGSSGPVRLRYFATDDGGVAGMPFLPNTKYCYRVRAKKDYPAPLGEVFSDYSTTACAVIPAIDVPTELTAIAEVIEDADYVAPSGANLGTIPKIFLSWKDNSIFETKYFIERKRGDITTPQVFKVIDSVTTILGQKAGVRYTDEFLEVKPEKKGLVPGAKYCYRVRAKISGGSFSNYSNESCANAYDIATSVDVKLSNAVKLYPNPACKSFMISFEGMNIRANKAEIINLMGQKVTEQDLTVTSEISLQKIKAGLYYVRIQSDKGTIVKKLVIEN